MKTHCPTANSILPILGLLVGLPALSAQTTVLFSQNFQDEVDASRTSLTASGWSNVGNDWIDAYDVSTYGFATAVAGGNNNFNALNGPSHSVSGITFSGAGETYAISYTLATNASSFNSGNRFVAGLSLTTSDPNGIYAFVGNDGGSNNYIAIATGNPVGGNYVTHSLTALTGSVSANTFYTLTLTLTDTTATATLLDGSTVVGTTVYTLSSPLSGTPYGAVKMGQRDGSSANLVYFSEVSVSSIPEPSSACAMGIVVVAFAGMGYYRSKKRRS